MLGRLTASRSRSSSRVLGARLPLRNGEVPAAAVVGFLCSQHHRRHLGTSDDSSSTKQSSSSSSSSESYPADRLNALVGHNFPDFIEHWNRQTYRHVGYGLTLLTATSAVVPSWLWLSADSTMTLTIFLPPAVLALTTVAYWRTGERDIRQRSHAVRRNYPVLGNLRYILETIRPELRQYIVEADDDGRPFDRNHRTQIYQRAKAVDDTIPFGTRRDVYGSHHEWACHSMFPSTRILPLEECRTVVGTSAFGTTQPYSASLLNISGMSYGAISDHAIMALNQGARLGQFYHNTGEGGVSQFHKSSSLDNDTDGGNGGDLVWNIGTGYFGCGSGTGEERVFEPALFRETLESSHGQIKMIELKLSQGAKPGHGGLLPKAKITPEIAAARKLPYPATGDCHSPARHSSFGNVYELVEFLALLRETSGGLPVGIKLCVGQPGQVAQLCRAIVDVGTGPDFITVDGAEGGTGAAPPELTNSVGLPLEEGLVCVRNLLVGAGLRDDIKLNASGRIASGFALVRTLALGADWTSAARAFMMSLGCIQALKCNTNKCPTGIATLEKELMFGLDPELKATRVYNFHRKTVAAAADILGVMGKQSFADLNGSDIMRRIHRTQVRTLAEIFPTVPPGCLLTNEGPERLQEVWNGTNTTNTASALAAPPRWIF